MIGTMIVITMLAVTLNKCVNRTTGKAVCEL
jgi:hypothetical protein